MESIWFVAIAVFFLTGFIFYKMLIGYVTESYGKKWLTAWGNKVYFWQSIILMSTGGTALILYILKWTQVLSF